MNKIEVQNNSILMTSIILAIEIIDCLQNLRNFNEYFDHFLEIYKFEKFLKKNLAFNLLIKNFKSKRPSILTLAPTLVDMYKKFSNFFYKKIRKLFEKL